VVNKDETSGTSVDEAALKITPAKAGNESRGNEGHGQEHLDIPAVLELDDRVTRKVAHISHARLPARLEDHPADVGPQKTMMCAIRVEVGIGIAMVRAMTTRPPLDGSLDGTRACKGKSVF
jgi:hypothetical protein